MPTFKLDDREISFEPGDTILRAADRAGVDIPHYCWHPGLSVAANCRMCLVELLPPPGRKPMMLDILRWDPELQTYKKEQKPKLVPACQQPAAPGMEVRSDTSARVREARHAVQELLLLNHPVDCPICDQAGECRLQDYWLLHQTTKKRMRDEPVHKPKAVSFGPTIVYDAERCVLCTRCIRFCDEVAKDPVLGLRERGNLNEVAVAPGRALDHNYTLMTESVCPVGALTAKDFRFKARVWFLRSASTVCNGCATGCNSFTDYDPRTQKIYRLRPRTNLQVNKYWMCDAGMLDYHRVSENRVATNRVGGESVTQKQALKRAEELLVQAVPQKLAVVLGSEFSLEDNAALLWLARRLGAQFFFETGRPSGVADGVLVSADRNPNAQGVRRLLRGEPARMGDLVDALTAGRVTHVLALGSGLREPELEEPLSRAGGVRVVLATHDGALSRNANVVLAASSWVESEGTFVNADGLAQRSERVIPPLGDSSPAHLILLALVGGLGFGAPWKSLAELRAEAAFAEGGPAAGRTPAEEVLHP